MRGTKVGNIEKANPKFGAQWKPTGSTTFRAAYFKVLKRKLSSDQGLEPTQIVGFNQFFDDPNGTISETTALGGDYQPSSTFGTGVEASHRRLKAPFLDLGEILYNARTEDSIASYAYWLPTNRLAISIQPRIQRIKGGDSFDEMDLQELPISARLAFPCGLWLGVSLTGVWQKGIFDGPGGVPNQGKDHFEVVDTLIAYRIPRRLGTISLEVNNLFNKNFQFQETDLSALPRYVPERRVFARLSLAL